MLSDILQGKPFGHPLHPLLIHFPIALFVLSLVLDVTSLLDAGNSLMRASFYALALGVATALVAAAAGLNDYFTIRADHPARQTATYHMVLNLFAVGIYVASLGWRWRALDAAEVPVLPILLSIAAFGVVSVSGYLGGKMVYEDGIAIGRHRRQTDPPRRTIEVAAPATPLQWLAVADATDLKEGATLRVAVGGTVMVVARVGGELRAFQEFCTHRFGPLSEGSFQDGQVMCPWHRSCFDCATGKVLHGPAKVDLRTFEAATRDGKICVRIPAEVQQHRSAG